MSEAYASALDISFDVRGGLLLRQIHHWAALFFMAAMMVHMFRIFFTGAFRKPRELNWVIGGSMILIGLLEGFAGYSLPDDLLSGVGVRIVAGIIESIPVIGTYLMFFIFGGEFPGNDFIPRLYTFHVLLVPGILLALDRRCTSFWSSTTSTPSTPVPDARTRTSSATRSSRSTPRRPAASSSSSSASRRSSPGWSRSTRSGPTGRTCPTR